MILGGFSFYLFQYEFYLYLEKSQITVMGNITSENPTSYDRHIKGLQHVFVKSFNFWDGGLLCCR